MDALAQVTKYEVARYGIEVVIVMPGAITKGTEPFNEGTCRADTATEAAYTRLDGMSDQILDRLNALSPPEADPRAVADEITQIVALPAGTRPFRPMVDFLHDDAEKMQADLMKRLGIDDLLHPTSLGQAS
jgi:NAD(P)-dependent dehydrogenase (short-subunit alcohol dehydrogenase family)